MSREIVLRADLVKPGDFIHRYAAFSGRIKQVAQHTDDEVYFQFESGEECRVPAARGLLVER